MCLFGHCKIHFTHLRINPPQGTIAHQFLQLFILSRSFQQKNKFSKSKSLDLDLGHFKRNRNQKKMMKNKLFKIRNPNIRDAWHWHLESSTVCTCINRRKNKPWIDLTLPDSFDSVRLEMSNIFQKIYDMNDCRYGRCHQYRRWHKPKPKKRFSIRHTDGTHSKNISHKSLSLKYINFVGLATVQLWQIHEIINEWGSSEQI